MKQSEYTLAIQGSYNSLGLALFKGDKLIESLLDSDQKASSHLVPSMQKILTLHDLTLNDLTFLAADYGPGAFTSLRVTIATLNGISFATGIPLVAVDSLQALTHEVIDSASESPPDLVISLLNAYNNDVYYQITKCDTQEKIDGGYKKVDQLLTQLQDLLSGKNALFTGNGTALHQDLITHALEKQAFFQAPLSLVPKAETIGVLGRQLFQNKKNIFNKIRPNYLKTQMFAVRN